MPTELYGPVQASFGAQTLTAGGLASGGFAPANYLSKYTWTNAMIVALGGVLTGDLTIATFPAGTVLKRLWMVVNTSAGGVTTLTGSIGKTAAAYADYFLTKDLKAAANTVYGQVVGDYAAALALYCGDMPSFTATTAIKLHLIATGANLSAVTTSTGSIYMETTILA